MPYWRMFYHLVWATKHRQSLITPEIETVMFPAIIHKARELDAFVYALNGTTDHIHLVAAIPPSIALGQFVGQLKGRSAYAVNSNCDIDFGWQVGYGVHTFGESTLRVVVDYVQRQKEHHAADTLYRDLERHLEDDDGPPPVIPGRAIDGPSPQ